MSVVNRIPIGKKHNIKVAYPAWSMHKYAFPLKNEWYWVMKLCCVDYQ